MTLPASGPISLSMIRGEFGGSAPDSLSEYYRGGGLVPDTAGNAGIPTSGPIALSDFYGGSATSYFVLGGSYEDINPISGGASLTLTYRSNGSIDLVGAVSGALFSAQWTTGVPGSQYIRADVTSGAFTTGSVGNDGILTVNRTWTLSLGGAGDIEVIATFTLKDAFAGNVLASDSIALRVASA